MRNKKKNRIQLQDAETPRRTLGDSGFLWLSNLVFFLCLFGFCVTTQVAAKTVEDIAVVVNQEAMTRGELEESIEGYFGGQQMKSAKPGTPAYAEAKKAVIESFVREVLLAEEADRDKIEVSESEIEREVNNQIDGMKKGFATEQDFNDELKKEGISIDDLKSDARDKILRRIKAGRALRMKQQDLPKTGIVTDAEARAYFEQHPTDFEQVKFSIILFRIPAKERSNAVYLKELDKQAQGLLKELKAGADFRAYAKKYSEDAGSAEKGGEVGTVHRVDLDPKLAKGIFAIPEKGMGIVKAADGVYIVKVDFKGEADYPSVASEIKAHLQGGKKDNGLKAWIEGLEKKANILVDGKPFLAAPSAEENMGSQTGGTSNVSGGTAEKPNGETEAAVPVDTEGGKPEIYPTLSQGGSWALSLGAQGFNYGSQDLADYHSPGVDSKQNFPFGFGLNAELDFAIDPTLEVGLLCEAFQKMAENVTDSTTGFKYKWSSAILGPSLALKVLIPLDEGTNFILSGQGGYYFLQGANLNIASGPSIEQADLNGSNWGGGAGGSLEFFLDNFKKSAFEVGIGYRYLRINPLTTKVTLPSTTGPAIPSPLLNNDINSAALDFSGVKAIANFRFYLDKTN